MAFSDLCHIGNAYQTIENETDQSENIMDDSFVRDLIVNLLEEGPPSDTSSSIPPPENTLSLPPNQYRESGTSLLPPYNYQNPLNFNLNDQNGFNYNMQNGLQNAFGNGFVNYSDNDVNTLLGVDLPDTTDTSPEQLNLLRLAAQQIGGAQFQSPNSNYNFFEPSQRNSLPETNMFSSTNFNRPNSLNLDMNFNNFDVPFHNQRFANNFKDNQDPSEILSYLTQLNMSLSDQNREENINSIDFNKPPELNGHYNEDFKAIEERNKMNQFFNRNFQQPNRTNENSHFFENMQERPPINFDFSNQTPVSTANNFKSLNGLNGFHQNDFMQRNMSQMQNFPNEQRNNFESNVGRDNMQQMALMRQQELARQMSLFMRNRPPPNQLNVDVSYLHDNNHFNLGLGALLGPSPPHPPPVLPSPAVDMPLLAPFYAMRNIRNAATSSGVLHARLDMCYEQWRQLERERKRTEARLALAYPGRAVSSSNSIPVPRLPPCPTRVDRLTVDMLREHTKVLTLMGKMETLRASVCVSQKKNKPEENKITVLKRGQDNVPGDEPGAFEPDSWRDDLHNIKEIAPHKEVENAMLNWRNAVTNVQAARKRELHPNHHNPRSNASDPILQLADAVKNLCVCARRARCAMWCDLTLTVALAPPPYEEKIETVANTPQTTPTKQATPDNAASNATAKSTASDNKEEKCTNETSTNSKPAQTKLTEKEKRDRRQANYKKHVQRNDFYRSQRYDTRFMPSRHPYHYLATGPIN